MAKTINEIKLQNRAQVEWKPSIRLYCCECAGDSACFGFKAPDGVSIEVLPCTGKIDPERLMKAFEGGADGVLIIGCPPGECKMLEGIRRAEVRSMLVRRMLDEAGIDGSRIEVVSSGAGKDRFSEACFNFYDKVHLLGPSVLNRVTA